jgi:hypothetical protein
MKALAEKLVSIEREAALEKGPFFLFALFLRENAPDVWDLLVSAPWIEADKFAAFQYLSKKLNKNLTKKELLALSRIVAINQTDPALASINSVMGVEHMCMEVENSNFFGLEIKHAYIITSRRPGA